MLKTTSQIISFYEKLENAISTQLSLLADRQQELSDRLNDLAQENNRHKLIIQRTYREGVTDAFEVGFLTDPLNEDDYKINSLEGNIDKAIEKAIENENTVIKFCRDAAERGSQLIPNLSQSFRNLIKRKERRKGALKDLLEN